MVSGVSACKNYAETTHKNGTRTIMTRMVIGAAMVKIEYFIHHTYYPDLSSITWTLDYTRESQLDESVGFWYIEVCCQPKVNLDLGERHMTKARPSPVASCGAFQHNLSIQFTESARPSSLS